MKLVYLLILTKFYKMLRIDLDKTVKSADKLFQTYWTITAQLRLHLSR